MANHSLKHQLRSNMLGKALILLSCFAMFISCNDRSGDLANAIGKYYTAEDQQSAIDCFSDDMMVYFSEHSENGLDKQRIAEMLTWDYALNPMKTFVILELDGDRITVDHHETNDLARLIDFPGWDAMVRYEVNEDGKISEILYLPSEEERNYKSYLKPALEWLEVNDSIRLSQVYVDEKIIQTKASAEIWVDMLINWRQATDKSIPEHLKEDQ